MYIYIDFWSVLLFHVYTPTTCMKKYSIDIDIKISIDILLQSEVVKIGGCMAVRTLTDTVFTK